MTNSADPIPIASSLLTRVPRPLAAPSWAWCGWSFPWEATPGERELCCRATDETGETQPLEPEWNVGGYENNAVQRVPVLVR